MTGVRLRGAGSNKPTPWLRRVFEQMLGDGFVPDRKWAVDLGAGNGRNAQWLRQQGMHTNAYDPAPAGARVILWNGRGWPPGCQHLTYDIILLQYVLMFVRRKGRKELAWVINNAARRGCVLVLETYNAVDSLYTPYLLQGFIYELNTRIEGVRWERRMFDGSDHVALQLQSIKED